MGLLSDIKAKILIEMRADTKQPIRATRALGKEQKKLAKDAVKGLEQQNDALDASIARWGKVAAGVGAVVGAVQAGRVAFDAFAQDAKLRGATVGISIDDLRRASKGLINDFDLLTQAAALNSTTFKLNTEEMAEVQRFMLILRKQGKDMVEVQERVTQAFIEGKVEGLEPFGIVIETTGTKVEMAAQLMKEMRRQNEKFTGSLAIAGDEAVKMGIKFDNFVRDAKINAVKLGLEVIPVMEKIFFMPLLAIKGWRALAKAVGDTADVLHDRFGKSSTVFAGLREGTKEARFQEFLREQKLGNALNQTGAGSLLELIGRVMGTGKEFLTGKDFSGKVIKQKRGRAIDLGIITPQFSGSLLGPAGPQFTDFGEGSRLGVIGGGISGLEAGLETTRFGIAAQDKAQRDALAKQAADMQAATLAARQDQSFLEGMFGKVEEFDLYVTAFDGLTTAIGAGMQALVTGSESVGSAVKKALAGFLGGEAVRMQIEAVKHFAYAAASVAFLDGRGAATHAKAAAAFQGGALLALGAARGLGSASGGGARAGGGGGGAPNVIGAGAAAGGGGGNITIIVGDDFSQTDPRKRNARLGRLIRDARRQTGADDQVRFG